MSPEPMSGLPDLDPNALKALGFGKLDKETIQRICDLRSATRGDPDAWRHPDLTDVLPDREEVNMAAPMPVEYEAAHEFMAKLFGPEGYTPDSVGQLVQVFVPCLRIMVERGYEPHGRLWQRAGVLGTIWDVRKKFERFWFRTWTLGVRHDDSGFDLINHTGFTMRADPDSRFGDAGEPAMPKVES